MTLDTVAKGMESLDRRTDTAADFRRLLASRFAARIFSDRRAFHLDWSVCDWAIDE
jgi:hypothetical protein